MCFPYNDVPYSGRFFSSTKFFLFLAGNDVRYKQTVTIVFFSQERKGKGRKSVLFLQIESFRIVMKQEVPQFSRWMGVVKGGCCPSWDQGVGR